MRHPPACHRPPPSSLAVGLSTPALLVLSFAHELLRFLDFSVMGVSARALAASSPAAAINRRLDFGLTPALSLSLSLSLPDGAVVRVSRVLGFRVWDEGEERRR